MSRHNRRRTRGGSKLALSFYPTDRIDSPESSIDKVSHIPKYAKHQDLTARHWHNRYMAWQTRERRQREEQDKLEAEQRRIFGGEAGDDVSLCYRMLEYFGGLDYLEP